VCVCLCGKISWLTEHSFGQRIDAYFFWIVLSHDVAVFDAAKEPQIRTLAVFDGTLLYGMFTY
jgi:hypothetical protein